MYRKKQQESNISLFVYNNSANLYSTTSLTVWILSNFSQHDSKSDSQGAFKPIEDITLAYNLILLKQLDNFYGKGKSLMEESLLPWFGSSLQCESYRQNFQQKLQRPNWKNLFDWSMNQWCLPICYSSKHTKHVFDFSCWSPDEIMWFFLYGGTSYLDAWYSLVFWVNF